MTGYWRRALANLKLEPIFGSKAFTPGTTCDDIHPGGPIRHGSICCCMACHQSGQDFRLGMQITKEDREALEAWKPPEGGDAWGNATPTKYEADQPEADKPKTRRQKRAEKYGKPREIPCDPDEIRRLVESEDTEELQREIQRRRRPRQRD